MEKSSLLGLLVFIGFGILFIVIILNICGSSYTASCEGFSSKGPDVVTLPASTQVKSNITYLPNAPFTELPDIPRPTYDPAYPRTLIPQLLQLKYDMDNFNERELPYLDSSDVAVTLPITRFKGHYQTVKAELLFLGANKYSPPELKVRDVEEMGLNLRFLQKQARTVEPMLEGFSSSSSSSSSPSPSSSSSSSSPSSSPSSSSPSSSSSSSSSFSSSPSSSSPSSSSPSSSSPSSNKNPISFTELQTLSLKLGVEIARLTATGTSDPIIQSRTNIYTQMRGTVDSLIEQINKKTLDPTKIPIAKSDYDAFLPALGSDSAGPGGILFNSGNTSLSSLFNSYNAGDLDGAALAETLFNTYADTFVKGMSYNVSLSYTSPNETTKEVAKALYRGEFQNKIDKINSDGFSDTPDTACNKTLAACQAACGDPSSAGYADCFSGCSPEFEECSRASVNGSSPDEAPILSWSGLNLGIGLGSTDINKSKPDPMSLLNSSYATPDVSAKQTTTIGFNWKDKCSQLYDALKSMDLDPGDFGCLAPGTQVSPDFSWRGNAKMICTRAATHSDPGVPEQIGCPPVSWPGWRS